MNRLRLLISSCILVVGLPSNTQSLVKKSKELKLMGSRFVITAIAENGDIAIDAINKGIAEIKRIEGLISSWDPSTQTSLINRNAGKTPVVVDQELFDLINRAKKISELTNGAFDISFASMAHLYTFNKEEQPLPDPTIINAAKSKINWKKIILDHEKLSVFLKDEGMKIGFGGIGKGYAADRAKKVIESIAGVAGGIVNASGDLSIWGKISENSDSWNIKIANPRDISEPLAYIKVKNTAVVTSGDYEKYFTWKGQRYSHIIDPKSGIPTVGIKSATIICPGAEIGDALATSIFVLGVEEGLYLINQLKGVEAFVITDDDQILTSENIELNYY